MIKYSTYLLLLNLLITCNRVPMEDCFTIVFSTEEDELLKSISIDSIEYVEWESQCYFFEDRILDYPIAEGVYDGRVSIIFENKKIKEIQIRSMFSSELPNAVIYMSGEKGTLLLKKRNCFFQPDGFKQENQELENFKRNNLKLFNYLSLKEKIKTH